MQYAQGESIGEIIRERNIILRGADALSARGFTQVPNHILDNAKLSPGAKLTYAMLLAARLLLSRSGATCQRYGGVRPQRPDLFAGA
jgi:hypothetical protein